MRYPYRENQLLYRTGFESCLCLVMSECMLNTYTMLQAVECPTGMVCESEVLPCKPTDGMCPEQGVCVKEDSKWTEIMVVMI